MHSLIDLSVLEMVVCHIGFELVFLELVKTSGIIYCKRNNQYGKGNTLCYIFISNFISTC